MAQSKHSTINYDHNSNQLQFIKPPMTQSSQRDLPFQGSSQRPKSSVSHVHDFQHAHSSTEPNNEDECQIATLSSPAKNHPQQQPVFSTASLNRAVSPDNATNEVLDRKFYTTMLEIDKRYQLDAKLQKHEKIRIEQWSRKLCQVTKNTQWKKNRNLYATWLLDMILNKKLEKPFTKVPDQSNDLEMLQVTEVRARLTTKVKNVLSKRDKSEEKKALFAQKQQQLQNSSQYLNAQVRQNAEQQTSNSHLIEEVDLTDMRRDNRATKPQRSLMLRSSRSRSNSIRRRTAQFAEDHRMAPQHQQSMDSFEQHDAQNYAMRSSIKSDNQSQQNLLQSKRKQARFHQRHDQGAENDPSTLEPNFSVDLLPGSALKGSHFAGLGNSGSPPERQSRRGQQAHLQQDSFDFYAPVKEDASVEAKAKIKDLQAQLVKAKSDKGVLEITVKHLKTELDGKSNLIRRQNDELGTLRESILELQRQNTLLRTQNLASKKPAGDGQTFLITGANATDCSVMQGFNNTMPTHQNTSLVIASPVRSPPTQQVQFQMPNQQLNQTEQAPQSYYSAYRRSQVSPPNPNSRQQQPQQQQQLLYVQPTSPITGSTYKVKIQNDVDAALQQFGMDIDRIFT